MEIERKEQPTAEDLLEILKILRSPEGCPWDREQTAKTLKKYLIEETAELADAVEDNDPAGICEEAGDVLMNLMMQCLVAAEQQQFTFADAVKSEYEKMIRRHPHVFGDQAVKNSTEVIGLWDKIKAAEPEKASRESVLDSVPRALPALLRAGKLQKKAAKCGFDWPDADGIIDKIQEELVEVKEALQEGSEAHIDEEIGDLLFAVVNLARFRNRCAEELLQQANRKFTSRFKIVEQKVNSSERTWGDFSAAELDNFWNEAKKLSVTTEL